MVRSILKRLTAVAIAAILAACGGSSSDTPSAQPVIETASKLSFDEKSILGYWQPKNPDQDAYEFYGTALNAALQYEPLTGPKSGRIFKNGQVTGMFYWTTIASGGVELTKVETSCAVRPLDKCPTIGTVSISVTGNALDGGTWHRTSPGVPGQVVGQYTRAKLDLTGLQGPFLMNAAELFKFAMSADVSNGVLTIQTQELGAPVALSAPLPSGPVASLPFAAGEATGIVVGQAVPTTSGQSVVMPVKVWLDNVVLSAGSGNGFILTFDMHRKVQPVPGVDPASLVLGDFEKTASGTDAFGRIASFVQGPTVQAGQTYYTMVPFLFNPATTVGGAGNVVTFTSATEGVISHTDIHGGKYSEAVPFMWAQGANGVLNITLADGPAAGLPVTVRFVKAVTGGHQAVFSFPDPMYPVMDHMLSDFVPHAPASITAATLPGKYVFDSTDGMTKNEVTFHKDGRVSGVVGGHWFIDADGEVISFECTDVQGRDLANYNDCMKTFDSVDTLKNYAFAHIRKMRFMHTANGVSQVRYDSVFYGSRFDIVDRDYAMVAWTYRFTRVGDE